MNTPTTPAHIGTFYRDWSNRMSDSPTLSLRDRRSLYEETHSLTAEPEAVTYAEGTVGGIEGIWCLPVGAATTAGSPALLYLHGGGFVFGSPASYRKLAGHLARSMQVRTFVPKYRLGPEERFPAPVEDVVATYGGLIDEGAEGVTLAGDSAGAYLAIAAAFAILESGSPRPGSVIALSPWVDFEMTGKSLETNAERDLAIQRQGLQATVRLLFGRDTPPPPSALPLQRDFVGFPRLYIAVGSDEVLLDDAVRLHERARAHGVDSRLSVGDGEQHVYLLAAGSYAAADEEIARIGTWYRA